MSILAQQLKNPRIKPKWWGSLGMVESVVRYNCMKKGFPVPVLAMPFWEGAGNKVYDVSGKMNHGTLINGAKWVAGMRSGNALAFDGVNDYVQITNSNSLNPNYITISAYIIAVGGDSSIDSILSKDFYLVGDLQRVWQFRKTTADLLQLIVFKTDTDNSSVTGSTDIADNKWHHVVGTWDGVNIKVYVDGKSDATPIAYAGSLQQGQTNAVLIGANETDAGKPTNFFSGPIDIPLIFGVALSAAQVKYLYDNPYFMYEMPEELWGYAAAVSGYTLIVASGSLSLSGTAAGLLAARILAAASGGIILSGTPVGTLKGSKIGAASGSLTLAGQDMGLLASRILAAVSGSITLSGTDVNLIAARKIIAASGAIVLAGTDVILIYSPLGGYTIVASSGNLSLAGAAVGLLASRKLPVASGSLTLSGMNINILKGSKIAAASGSLTLTGIGVDLLALRKLIAASGVIVLTGSDVGFIYSGLITKAEIIRLYSRINQTLPLNSRINQTLLRDSLIELEDLT